MWQIFTKLWITNNNYYCYLSQKRWAVSHYLFKFSCELRSGINYIMLSRLHSNESVKIRTSTTIVSLWPFLGGKTMLFWEVCCLPLHPSFIYFSGFQLMTKRWKTEYIWHGWTSSILWCTNKHKLYLNLFIPVSKVSSQQLGIIPL